MLGWIAPRRTQRAAPDFARDAMQAPEAFAAWPAAPDTGWFDSSWELRQGLEVAELAEFPAEWRNLGGCTAHVNR
jgi:hypothetical protein